MLLIAVNPLISFNNLEPNISRPHMILPHVDFFVALHIYILEPYKAIIFRFI